MDIGKILQDARTARNITLDTAAQETNIRKIYLEAIEKNDFTALPGAVFVKGIIRTYGNYLGLDGARLVEEFKSSLSGNAVVNNNTIRESRDVRVRPTFKSNRDIGSGTGSDRKILWILCGIVAVLLAAGGFYYYFMRSGQETGISVPFLTDTVNRPAKETPAPGKDEGRKESVPAAAVIPPKETKTADGVKTVPDKDLKKEAAKAAKPGVTVLSLTSRGKCWLRVTNPKGAVLYEGTLRKGETRQFSGKEALTVNIGNLKDLQIEYNGRVLPAEATKEPVIRTYVPAGKES